VALVGLRSLWSAPRGPEEATGEPADPAGELDTIAVPIAMPIPELTASR
jgi:hypothetical protein